MKIMSKFTEFLLKSGLYKDFTQWLMEISKARNGVTFGASVTKYLNFPP